MRVLLLAYFFFSSNLLAQVYKRTDYPHWIDVDRDCQDTRAEVLIRYTSAPIKFKRQKGTYKKEIADLGRKSGGPPVKKPCSVSSGKWSDPYSGKIFYKAGELDVDHIIPLKHAHTRGAANWSKKKRRKFANDIHNLLPVSKKLNRKKGSKGINSWLPPYKPFRCSYARIWENLKKQYDLEITPAEQKTIDGLKSYWCDKKNYQDYHENFVKEAEGLE